MESQIEVDCAIAGGGPAGIMLGYLLARAGVRVLVCEKWPDFFRDFRGDTIHPSTMDVLHELGLLEDFLKLPHDETYKLEGDIGNARITLANFSHLPLRCPFIAFLPQWDFLNFIASHGASLPGFQIAMDTDVEDLLQENGAVVGLRARKKDGSTLTVRAQLVVGADGRHSTIREKAGIPLVSEGAPMDVLWFRISRKESDPKATLGRMDRGHMMVMIDRGSYWQCGYLIPKGTYASFESDGLDGFRSTLAALQPFLADRTAEIKSLEDLKLLAVTLDHAATWHKPGVLLIGDSAHAMSPIGGVGINLAIQDAVAAANILAPKLREKSLEERDLARVQKRRAFPARLIQRIQIQIQNRVIKSVLQNQGTVRPARIFRIINALPLLQRIPAYLIGVGVRPEHVAH